MKPRKGYFVYKYVVSDEIIYIGIAKDIVRRIREHARCQGLDSKFEPYINKAKIYVHKCSTYGEMRALETILIDLHKPVLNESGKTDIPSSLSQTGDYGPWTLYNEEDYIEKKMMPTQNKAGKSKVTTSLKKYFHTKTKIYCSVCGEDLSKTPEKVVVHIHARNNHNSGKHDSMCIHTVCRGNCSYYDKKHEYDLYYWFFLSDLFNPALFLKRLFFIMSLMNDGSLFESKDELMELQSLFLQMSPNVLRNVDEKDQEEWTIDNMSDV